MVLESGDVPTIPIPLHTNLFESNTKLILLGDASAVNLSITTSKNAP